MKPVYQTVIDPDKGNCMQAALASLFELELEEVPDFVTSDISFEYFLNKHGYILDGLLCNWNEKNTKNLYTTIDKLSEEKGIKGLFYASVYSPKYTDVNRTLEEVKRDYKTVCHAVICDQNYNIVFDPNPENKNIEKYPFADELGYNGILNVFLIKEST